ncbi:MAG: fibronectin type III domain-containing protein [Leucobacter sp.]
MTIAGAAAVPLLLMAAIPSTAWAVDGGAGGGASNETGAEPGNESIAERITSAAEAGASTPEALAEAVSLPVEGSGALNFSDDGRITASLVFDGVPSDATVEAVRAIAEITGLMTQFGAATVLVAPEQLADLGEIDGVLDASPALTPATGNSGSQVREQLTSVLPAANTDAGETCGAVPAEADAPLHVDEARSAFDTYGVGVTIGIISDTFDAVQSPSVADDVAAGALPGPGNPCGWETPVEKLADQEETTWSDSDEGRGMAQLVHSIAPGAKLIVADSGDTQFAMLANIAGLAEAGADIIVDDISFFDEAYYQRDVLSVVIQMVRDQGVTYFSSAGNATVSATTGAHVGEPINSWQTRSYRPMECPAWVEIPEINEEADTSVAPDCLDFDPTATEQAYDTLTSDEALGTDAFELQVYGSIAEPVNGVTTSYRVQFYAEDANDPEGTDPDFLGEIESIGSFSPSLVGTVALPWGSQIRVVVMRTDRDEASTRLPAIFLGLQRGAGNITERQFMGDGVNDWVGEGTFGHPANGAAIGVASLAWDAPTTVRPYSSLGPGTLLFEDVTLPITAGSFSPLLPEAQIIDSPQVAGVDGMQTSFFGAEREEDGETVYRFFGTSAAAPTVAAVAALGLSYDPSVRGDALGDLVIDTARGTDEGGPVNPYNPAVFTDAEVFGAGIADATRLLQRIHEDAPTPAQPTGLSVRDIAANTAEVNWNALEGADRSLIAIYEGEAIEENIIEASSIPVDQTSYELIGLDPETEYSVSLTAVSALGKLGEPAFTSFTTAAAPSPGPAPDPAPAPDGQVTPAGAKTGQLSTTGGETPWGWIIGGIALLVVGGAVTAISVVRSRRAHAPEPEAGVQQQGDDIR